MIKQCNQQTPLVMICRLPGDPPEAKYNRKGDGISLKPPVDLTNPIWKTPRVETELKDIRGVLSMTRAVPQELAQLIAQKDHIVAASLCGPSSIKLEFADGLEGTWPLSALEMDFSNMKLETIRQTPERTAIQIESEWGDGVAIDSGTIRAMVDPSYQSELQAAYCTIIGSPDSLPTSRYKPSS